MGSKRKGTRAERELIHMFYDSNEWIAVRAAGSGSIPLPCPDIIVGNGKRRLAIECKSLGNTIKYFKKQELAELLEFSKKFGAEAWVGIRFDHIGWFFLQPDKLELSSKGTPSISVSEAKSKGISFDQLIKL
ncbi:Holliday junction resolvase [Candidatus Woesearchaeota archaeon]|nr:Holliday junction resolvase [Candidatus Woesearchaeota archaeon]